jgi:putative acetyltransferase
VDVRAEAVGDRSAVRAVHLTAFGEHGQVVANLVDDLRDAVARGDGLSLVAEERDQIVGHVMFSTSLLDAPKRLVPVQVLSPIGVLPARQKQGIGTTLIRRGLELLVERNVPLVFWKGRRRTTRASDSDQLDRTGSRNRRCASRTQRSKCSDCRPTSPG